MYYSPNNKEYLELPELQKKFNACIPASTVSYMGYSKVYPSDKPTPGKFQKVILAPTPIFKQGRFYEKYLTSYVTIDEAKNILLKEAKEKYENIKNSKDTHIMSSLGVNIQCNADSINNLVQMMYVKKDSYTFITYENTFLECTREKIEKILEEISTVQENLYIQYQNYKSIITSLKYIQDVIKLEITYSLEL